MGERGKLIAVEGIDGSGKQTQVRLLARELESRGHLVLSTGFPHYDSWFGKMVGQFLNGNFGPLDSVDPHFTALLYAGDRFEGKRPIVAALESGGVVLADRYVGSNLAHQSARTAPEKRAEFRAWIEHLEYNIYELPKEDLVLYLRLPPHEAQTLVAKKSARKYTDAAHDILESNIRHLQDAAAMYDLLARGSNWKTIECFDDAKQVIRSPEEISAEILAAVLPCFAPHKENP
ncbi:MAG: thymidylate kinase [Acidobacteria bacterium]|nr:MAG: thymidylate kinase [Acidobacteriota bacterium]